jgi:AmiR/NasT family two-component response regulator
MPASCWDTPARPTLGEGMEARQDVGTAVGIVMERYQVDRDRAFEFVVRISNHRHVKVRAVAAQIVDGTFALEQGDEVDST